MNDQPSAARWAKALYTTYRGGVALLEVEAPDGARHHGTAFHVGEGIYVTAAHVLRDQRIIEVRHELEDWQEGDTAASGPFFHPDASVDVACFTLADTSRPTLRLGGHLDDWINDDAFLLWRTLVIGYPAIPLARRPVPVVVSGEINAVVDLYTGVPHPRFIISTMARGGFSGAPVFTGYSEEPAAHADILGVVTESLLMNDKPEETGFMAVLSVEAIYTCLEAHDLLPACQAQQFDGLFKVRGQPEQPSFHRGLERVQKAVRCQSVRSPKSRSAALHVRLLERPGSTRCAFGNGLVGSPLCPERRTVPYRRKELSGAAGHHPARRSCRVIAAVEGGIGVSFGRAGRI